MGFGPQYDSIFGYTLSSVPFVNYTDGNRAQMAASMIKQSQPLIQPEVPIIATWYYQLPIQSMFVQRAKKDGVVVESQFFHVLVEYNDGELDIFTIPNLLWKTYVKPGQRVKKNDVIIAHLNYDPKYDCYRFGVNAFVAWGVDDYTFEDAIVMSEQGVQKFTSYFQVVEEIEISANKIIQFPDDKPLDIGQKITRQKPILILRNSPNSLMTHLIPTEEYVYYSKRPFQITNITVYYTSDEVLKDQPDYVKDWLLKFSFKNKLNNYIQRVKHHKELVKFYLNRTQKLESDILIVIEGIQLHTPELGDKFANLWGNKGVLACVNDNSKMLFEVPGFKDPFVIDIMHTPIGVPSRMNDAQVLYGNLAFFLKYVYPKHLKKVYEKDGLDKALEDILKVYKYIDPATEKWMEEQFKSLSRDFLEECVKDAIENGLYMRIASFTYDTVYRAYKLLKEFNCPMKGYYPRWNKELGFGVIYTMKLEHLAQEKIKFRSVGEYNKRTLQPEDGQRMGEMEVWTITCTPHALYEVLTVKSDDLEGKQEVLTNIVTDGKSNLPKTTDAKVLDLLNAYFVLQGMKLENYQMQIAEEKSDDESEKE